jgi:hypothetical protein
MRLESSPEWEEEEIGEPNETPSRSGAYPAKVYGANKVNDSSRRVRNSGPTIVPPPDRNSDQVVMEQDGNHEPVSETFTREQMSAYQRIEEMTQSAPELLESKIALEIAFPNQPIRVLRELEDVLLDLSRQNHQEDEVWATGIEMAEGESLRRRAEIIEKGRAALIELENINQDRPSVDQEAETIAPPKRY